MTECMIANMAPADLKHVRSQHEGATYTQPTPVCALKDAYTLKAGVCEGGRGSERVRPDQGVLD
jgi:hypothetical protein